MTTANSPTAGFSVDYATARQRFRAAALQANVDALDALSLDDRASDGAPLSIDIAWFGPRRPRRVLLHSCGLHGVEGFAGSAIQHTLLGHPPVRPNDGAVVFVHGLNPYGMDRLRRVNEHNVDLNRNCLTDGSAYRGVPDDYRLVEPLLNPTTAPTADGFYLRALASVMRHGYGRLRRAVATGQYEYERGLFFGGRGLEPGPGRYRAWLAQRLAGVAQVCAIDVHTGLGRWGRETLFAESPAAGGPLGVTLGRPLTFADCRDPSAYIVRGGLAAALPSWVPQAQVSAFTQEFGTYPGLHVLHALREENRWHHYGAGALDHPCKMRLRTVFCPLDARWRERVLERGVDLVHRAAAALFGER
ncbi:MAG: DUF2817 domain-containing protein [Gammaproteobacteria bacterium]